MSYPAFKFVTYSPTYRLQAEANIEGHKDCIACKAVEIVSLSIELEALFTFCFLSSIYIYIQNIMWIHRLNECVLGVKCSERELFRNQVLTSIYVYVCMHVCMCL